VAARAATPSGAVRWEMPRGDPSPVLSPYSSPLRRGSRPGLIMDQVVDRRGPVRVDRCSRVDEHHYSEAALSAGAGTQRSLAVAFQPRGFPQHLPDPPAHTARGLGKTACSTSRPTELACHGIAGRSVPPSTINGRPERRSNDGQMILKVPQPDQEPNSDLRLCGAPLRNRTVDLLLTMENRPLSDQERGRDQRPHSHCVHRRDGHHSEPEVSPALLPEILPDERAARHAVHVGEEQRPKHALAMEVAVAVATGAVGLRGPDAAAIATSLSPLALAGLGRITEAISSRRLGHAAETLMDGADAYGAETAEQFLKFVEAAVSDEGHQELLARTLTIAQDTAMRDKRRALGRALASAASDTGTKVDEELLFIRVLADLDEPFIRLLRLTSSIPRDLGEKSIEDVRHWFPWNIGEADPGLAGSSWALLGTLQRHGLVYVTSGEYFMDNRYEITASETGS